MHHQENPVRIQLLKQQRLILNQACGKTWKQNPMSQMLLQLLIQILKQRPNLMNTRQTPRWESADGVLPIFRPIFPYTSPLPFQYHAVFYFLLYQMHKLRWPKKSRQFSAWPVALLYSVLLIFICADVGLLALIWQSLLIWVWLICSSVLGCQNRLQSNQLMKIMHLLCHTIGQMF